MNKIQLLPIIIQIKTDLLNGYYYYLALAKLEETISLPNLGHNAGVIGGLIFAAKIK